MKWYIIATVLCFIVLYSETIEYCVEYRYTQISDFKIQILFRDKQFYLQFTTFITSKCTSNFVIKGLSTILAFTILLTKYILFRVHIETVSR